MYSNAAVCVSVQFQLLTSYSWLNVRKGKTNQDYNQNKNGKKLLHLNSMDVRYFSLGEYLFTFVMVAIAAVVLLRIAHSHFQLSECVCVRIN